MKIVAVLLLAVVALAGCAVVPIGPPVGVGVYVSPGYYGPRYSGPYYSGPSYYRYGGRGRW